MCTRKTRHWWTLYPQRAEYTGSPSLYGLLEIIVNKCVFEKSTLKMSFNNTQLNYNQFLQCPNLKKRWFEALIYFETISVSKFNLVLLSGNDFSFFYFYFYFFFEGVFRAQFHRHFTHLPFCLKKKWIIYTYC